MSREGGTGAALIPSERTPESNAQGRADNGERAIYTIVAPLPIEADGRIRYRIKSNTENFERVVTEDQLVGELDALCSHR